MKYFLTFRILIYAHISVLFERLFLIEVWGWLRRAQGHPVEKTTETLCGLAIQFERQNSETTRVFNFFILVN